MAIWLIGGTSESKQLAIALHQQRIPFVVTVTTESARNLYSELNGAAVRVGKLNASSLSELIQTSGITAILDASHPFAVEISALAIACAQQGNLSYLRFERAANIRTQTNPWVKHFSAFEDLLQAEYLADRRVLLTVGYQALPLFSSWHGRSTLYARVLPSTVAIEAAIQAGFSPDRIIAIRPPIAAALEKALWQQWQITTAIAKASGIEGGETVKCAIAAELQIPLLIVNRPTLSYPSQTDSMEKAVLFCQKNVI